MIRAVLFDLDGTVINTNELVLKSWEYALQKNLGYSPCRDELIQNNMYSKEICDIT